MRVEKCLRNFGWKTLRKKGPSKTQMLYGVILKLLKSADWDYMDCVYFDQDNDHWPAVVYKKMKLQSV
jgi:hypothetical protein